MSFIQENALLLNAIKQERLQSKCRLSTIVFEIGFVCLFMLNDIFCVFPLNTLYRFLSICCIFSFGKVTPKTLSSFHSYFLSSIFFGCSSANCIVFLTAFCVTYLAAPRPTMGHWREGSPTYPILITMLYLIRPEGHWEPINEAGSKNPAECI